MASKIYIRNTRRAAQRVLADLKEPELRVARDFLEYLRMRAADSATMEILSNPALMRDIREARNDLQSGKKRRFVSWKTVRKNV